MRHRSRRVAFLLVASVLLGGSLVPCVARAGTINVPADQPTLQAAVAAAANGDVILFAPGTYAGGAWIEGKSITVASRFYTTGDTSYISQTVLSGSASNCGGTAGCRGDAVLEFGPHAHGGAVVGLTITNGVKGVRSGSFVDITSCHVYLTEDGTNYTAGSGGTFRDNVFERNRDDGVDLNDHVVVRVVNNIIRDNGDDGVEFRLYPYSGPTTTNEFVGNRITGNVQDGIQFIDYPDTSHRILRVERNYFGGNRRAAVGCLANGATVQDYSGPQIPERILLLHNTFVGNHYGVSGGGNLIALGNLFTGSTNTAVWRVGTNSIAAYNLFWNNVTDAGGSNVDASHTRVANPLLDDQGLLTAGSPAIDAGTAFFSWGGETVLDVPPSGYLGAAPDLGWAELDFTATTLAIEDASIAETQTGSIALGFRVRVGSPADHEITVAYTTADGSATTPDADYVANSGILTLPANAAEATIPVTVNGDERPEGDETFTVTLANAVGATIVRTRATGTIVNDDGVVSVVEARVAIGADDAEESGSGGVSTGSSDLEMMIDGTVAQRRVAMRFANLAIPPGATVTKAWVQFRAKESQSEATSLVIRGEAIDHAPAFGTGNGALSALPLTTRQVSWPTLVAWTTGQVGLAQRTPELQEVIQEIVGRSGWRKGNALAIVVTGTGHRTASAFENGAANAALLHVEFATGPVTNRAPAVNAGPDTTVVRPGTAALHGAVADDGLPAPALVTTQWSAVASPGAVTFGNAFALVTAATFAAPGTYHLELTVGDGELIARDTMDVIVTDAPPGGITTTVEVRIAAGADDVEESSSGSVSNSSSDLEMMIDGTAAQRRVGMRFLNLAIPAGATVTRAWVQFRAKESQSEATSLTIQGEAVDHAPAFSTARLTLSALPVTTRQVSWPTLPAWTTGQVGAAQRTPELKDVIQEIVGRTGWRTANALAILVTGTGHRTAASYENGAANAALLHVEFTSGAAAAPTAAASGDAVAAFGAGTKFGARLHPNPPSRHVTLSLVTTRIGFARVRLYDTQGRRIRVLLDEPALAAGRHVLAFDTHGAQGRLRAGMYFYSVEAAEGRLQGKFTVLE